MSTNQQVILIIAIKRVHKATFVDLGPSLCNLSVSACGVFLLRYLTYTQFRGPFLFCVFVTLALRGTRQFGLETFWQHEASHFPYFPRVSNISSQLEWEFFFRGGKSVFMSVMGPRRNCNAGWPCQISREGCCVLTRVTYVSSLL